MTINKDEYFYDVEKFQESLREEVENEESIARDIVNENPILDEKTAIKLQTKAKKEGKTYLSFKSDLQMMDIVMRRDLCVEALKQDLLIEKKGLALNEEIDDIKNRIYSENAKPIDAIYSIAKTFVSKDKPKEPCYREFRKKNIAGVYKYNGVLGGTISTILFSLALIYLMFYSVLELKFIWYEFVIVSGILSGILFFIWSKTEVWLSIMLIATVFIIPITLLIAIQNALNKRKIERQNKEIRITYQNQCLKIKKENYENFVKLTKKVDDKKQELNQEWERNKEVREARTKELRENVKYCEFLIQELNCIKGFINKSFKCPDKYDNITIKEELLNLLENYMASNLIDAIRYYEQKLRDAIKDEKEKEFRSSQLYLMREQIRGIDNMSREQRDARERERIANERYRQEQMAKLEEVNRQMATIKDQNKDIINRQEKLKQEVKDINSPSAYGHYVELSSMDINSIADEVARKL